MTDCEIPKGEVSALDLVGSSNDLTALYTMRYRLESDPDIDASYSAVTTRSMLGVTIPFFDITTVDPGTYILHTYLTSDGTGTGSKVTIVVECDDAT